LGKSSLSRIILSDEFCSLDDAKALKRGKAFGHAANPQSLKQNYGRGAPARDIKRGFTIASEALGGGYGLARERADAHAAPPTTGDLDIVGIDEF
jgi:hypothetical protein